MLQIVIGFLLVLIGAFITIKANALYQAIGPIQWAEAHLLTAGGSRFFYKLIGVSLIILGFMIMTGLIEGVIVAIFSRLFSSPTSIDQL